MMCLPVRDSGIHLVYHMSCNSSKIRASQLEGITVCLFGLASLEEVSKAV
jgi:hypothetical protein